MWTVGALHVTLLLLDCKPQFSSLSCCHILIYMAHNKLKKIVIFIACTFLMCSISIVILILLNQPGYFEKFTTPDQVKAHLLSTFVLGYSSKQDVQNAIDKGQYGKLECNWYSDGDIDDRLLHCSTLTAKRYWFGSWYYVISFYFDGDILADVRVEKTYRGL